MSSDQRTNETDSPATGLLVALAIAAATFVWAVFPTLEWREGPHLAFPIFNNNDTAYRISEAVRFLGYGVAGLLSLVAAAAVRTRRVAVGIVIACVLLTDAASAFVELVGEVMRLGDSAADFQKVFALRSFVTLVQSVPLNIISVLVGMRAVRPLGTAARVGLCVCAVLCLIHPSLLNVLYSGVSGDNWHVMTVLAQFIRPMMMLAVLPLVSSAPALRGYALAWAVALPFFVVVRQAMNLSVQSEPAWWLVAYFAVDAVVGAVPSFAPGWLFARTPSTTGVDRP